MITTSNLPGTSSQAFLERVETQNETTEKVEGKEMIKKSTLDARRGLSVDVSNSLLQSVDAGDQHPGLTSKREYIKNRAPKPTSILNLKPEVP